jgi:hypothetical protein
VNRTKATRRAPCRAAVYPARLRSPEVDTLSDRAGAYRTCQHSLLRPCDQTSCLHRTQPAARQCRERARETEVGTTGVNLEQGMARGRCARAVRAGGARGRRARTVRAQRGAGTTRSTRAQNVRVVRQSGSPPQSHACTSFLAVLQPFSFSFQVRCISTNLSLSTIQVRQTQ